MFGLDLDGKIRPVFPEKYEIENGDDAKSLAQLEHSDYQTSEARITNDSLIEHYLTGFKFSTETLPEKIKHVGTKNIILNFDISKKNHISIFDTVCTLMQGTS